MTHLCGNQCIKPVKHKKSHWHPLCIGVLDAPVLRPGQAALRAQRPLPRQPGGVGAVRPRPPAGGVGRVCVFVQWAAGRPREAFGHFALPRVALQGACEISVQKNGGLALSLARLLQSHPYCVCAVVHEDTTRAFFLVANVCHDVAHKAHCLPSVPHSSNGIGQNGFVETLCWG